MMGNFRNPFADKKVTPVFQVIFFNGFKGLPKIFKNLVS